MAEADESEMELIGKVKGHADVPLHLPTVTARLSSGDDKTTAPRASGESQGKGKGEEEGNEEGDEAAGAGVVILTSEDDDEQDLDEHLRGDPIPRDILVSKAFYFVISSGYSCVSPYLPLFFDSLGFSKTQTGLLYSVQPFLNFVGGSLGTLLADKTGKYKLIFALSLVLTGALRLSLFGVADFWATLGVVFATESVSSPIFPLLDNAILEALRSESGSYGRVRLWGAVGWGIFAAVMGWVITQTDLKAIFVGFAAFVCLALPLLFWFPMGHSHLHDELCHQERLRKRREDSTLTKLRNLFSSFAVLSFFFTVLTLGYSMGSIISVLFIYLKSLGASEFLMGLSLTFTCIAEVPFFFFFDKLVAIMKVRGVLYLSFVCYIIRLLYYSFLTDPWFVLPAELLHGITYAAAWSACVLHAKEIAPRGLEATMQGLLTGAHWGIGVGVGTLMGGFFYDHLGPVNTFRVTTGIAGAGMVLFFLSNLALDIRERRRSRGA